MQALDPLTLANETGRTCCSNTWQRTFAIQQNYMLSHALALVTVLFIYVCSRCFLYMVCDQNDHAFSVPDPRCYVGSVCRAFIGPQQFDILTKIQCKWVQTLMQPMW